MHLWAITKWKKFYSGVPVRHRDGLRARFEKGIDADLRNACIRFCDWARHEYFFPIRVCVYFKKDELIRAMDGEMVSATFFGPYDKMEEPYIRVSTGDFGEIKARNGRDNAVFAILHSVAHELTHYFQWVNGLELTAIGEERQAAYYADIIIDEYMDVYDHP